MRCTSTLRTERAGGGGKRLTLSLGNAGVAYGSNLTVCALAICLAPLLAGRGRYCIARRLFAIRAVGRPVVFKSLGVQGFLQVAGLEPAIDADRATDEFFFLGLVRHGLIATCLLYTSPSPRDATLSRMPSSA